jgi:hypothetical protein
MSDATKKYEFHVDAIDAISRKALSDIIKYYKDNNDAIKEAIIEAAEHDGSEEAKLTINNIDISLLASVTTNIEDAVKRLNLVYKIFSIAVQTGRGWEWTLERYENAVKMAAQMETAASTAQ